MSTTPLYGIEFEELNGSPTINVGQDGVRAVRNFRIGWGDIVRFCKELVGEYIAIPDSALSPTFLSPIPFPGFPYLIVDTLSVEPFGDGGEAKPDSVTVTLGSVTNSYGDFSTGCGAKVTANYKSIDPPQDQNGGPEVAPGTILSVDYETGAEYTTQPGRGWVWSGGAQDGLAVDSDVNPGYLMPTQDITMSWDRVPTVPWSSIRSLAGSVNASTFLDVEAGKLLFLGAKVNRKFQFFTESDVSSAFYQIEYRFSARDKEWNKFFNPTTGDWTTILAAGTNDPPYADGSFSSLFY